MVICSACGCVRVRACCYVPAPLCVDREKVNERRANEVVDGGVMEETDVSVGVASDTDEGLVDLGCPLPTDVSGCSVLIAQIQIDQSLSNCRELATKGLNGYKWSEGLGVVDS